MRKNRIHSIITILVVIAVCAAGLPLNAQAENNAAAQNQNISVQAPVKELTAEEKEILDFKTEVLKLVNVEREKAGFKPVTILDELEKAADLRALEININFSHTRPGGESWNTVFAKFDLKYTFAGENLAKGFKTPEAVMKAWMNSPGHKANILNPKFANIGIGYFKDASGKINLAQILFTKVQQ